MRPRCHAGRVADTDHLLDALRLLTGRPDADFRDGQREAIEALVDERSRVLVVQRTGWGKSAVYFLTTHLLREQGLGPTLLISPLLALMRNQIDAAAAARAAMRDDQQRVGHHRSPNSNERCAPTRSTCC